MVGIRQPPSAWSRWPSNDFSDFRSDNSATTALTRTSSSTAGDHKETNGALLPDLLIDFGVTITKNSQALDATPKDDWGLHELMPAPYDWSKEPTDPIVGMHPTGVDHSFDNVVPFQTEEEKHAKAGKYDIAKLKGWPWATTKDVDQMEKLVLLAPYTVNKPRNAKSIFKLPKHKQKSSLLNLLKHIELIRLPVVDYLYQSHESLWKFGSTCQESMSLIMRDIDTWDMTSGQLVHCANPPYHRESNNPDFGAKVNRCIVVTPVRTDDRHYFSYETQITNFHKLTIAISNFSRNIANIQLHCVPFLSVASLRIIIPNMTKLQTLGIYQCPMIDLSAGDDLFALIKEDRPLGKEYQVNLDWYPRRHHGPQQKPGRKWATGCYAVTWDDSGSQVRNVTTAIWQMVFRYIQLAYEHGIDFVSPHTAFRKWLDNSPCVMVEKTLGAMLRHLGYRRSPIPLYEFVGHIIYVEVNGNFNRVLRPEYECKSGRRWMMNTRQCSSCQLDLLGVWFDGRDVFVADHISNTHATCASCQLTAYLAHEEDHYKKSKRQVVDHSICNDDFTDDPPNTNDLAKLIDDFAAQDVARGARVLDRKRLAHVMTRGAWDHEGNERQMAVPARYLNTRVGSSGRRAATMEDKLIFETNENFRLAGGDTTWQRHDRHRLRGHGHVY